MPIDPYCCDCQRYTGGCAAHATPTSGAAAQPLPSSVVVTCPSCVALRQRCEELEQENECLLEAVKPPACGTSPVVQEPTRHVGGCSEPVQFDEIIRCADCLGAFHRACFRKHCEAETQRMRGHCESIVAEIAQWDSNYDNADVPLVMETVLALAQSALEHGAPGLVEVAAEVDSLRAALAVAEGARGRLEKGAQAVLDHFTAEHLDAVSDSKCGSALRAALEDGATEHALMEKQLATASLAVLARRAREKGRKDDRERCNACGGTGTTDYLKHDPTRDQDELLPCGHPYYRHFDTYDAMRAVGCKYCDCQCLDTLAPRGREETR